MGYAQCIFGVPTDRITRDELLAVLVDAMRELAGELALPDVYALVDREANARKRGLRLFMLGRTAERDTLVDRGAFAEYVGLGHPLVTLLHDDRTGVHLFRHDDPEGDPGCVWLRSDGPYLGGHLDVFTVDYPQKGFSRAELAALHDKPEAKRTAREARAIMDYDHAITIGLRQFFPRLRAPQYLDLLDLPEAYHVYSPKKRLRSPTKLATPARWHNMFAHWPDDADDDDSPESTAEALLEQALARIEQASALAGEHAVALLNRACDDLRRACELCPDRGDLLHRWGSCIDDLAGHSAGDLERRLALRRDACDKLQRATRLDPELADAFHDWGAVLAAIAAETDDPGEKRRLLRKAADTSRACLALDPRSAQVHHNLADALRDLANLGRGGAPRAALLREACTHYAAAIAEDPDRPAANHHWALSLEQLAESEESPEARRRLLRAACERQEAAFDGDPTRTDALDHWASHLLAWSRLYPGQPQRQRPLLDRAHELLKRCARLQKIPVAQLYNYACLMARRGERAKALHSLAASLRAHETDLDHVRRDPDWHEFRSDREFIDLLARLDAELAAD